MFKKFQMITLTMVTLVSISFHTCKVKAFETNILDTINSQYAIVIDYDTDQVIANKNADEKMYPASMTKMMTAIIAIENLTDMSQTVTITDDMLAGLKEEDAALVGFKTGDTPTIQDILYGIALPSGADATNAAAFTVSGSIEAYVELMNQKATEIGMTNTHFVNTSGLHDENHYSTARDIATLLKYCLQNETFKTVFSAHEYTTTSLASAPEGIQLTNTIFTQAEKNQYDITGLIGGKTGFTYPAGHCLAAWSTINDMNLITVVANADAASATSPHIQDTSILLTSLRSWNKMTLLDSSTSIQSILIDHAVTADETIQIYPTETVIMDLPQEAKIKTTCTFPSVIEPNFENQTITGEISVTVNGELIYTTTAQIEVAAEKNLLDKLILWLKDL